MTTRLYLSSSSSPATAINPAFAAGWNKTTGAQRRVASTVKDGSTLADTGAFTGTGTNPNNVCARQFVYGPINAQTITGFVKGQVRVTENNVALNAQAQMTIRVIAPDATTVRGTLLALDASAASSEFSTTSTNRKFPLAALWGGSGVALTSVTAQAGDYIVIEMGAQVLSTDTTSNFVMRFGSSSATDFPEDETTTAADNPWVEFSMTLALGGPTFSGISKITASPSQAEPVPLYGIAELQFDLSDDGTRTAGGAVNPWSDVAILPGESVIKVDANVTIGGETRTFPCFWDQRFTKSGGTGGNESYATTGSPHWRLRFMVWRTDSSAVVDLVATNASGTGTSVAAATFTVTATTTYHGPPKVDPLDPQLMRYADGTPYLPLGNNIAHDQDGAPDDGTIKWAYMQDAIINNGGNSTKFWLWAYCRTGLEWSSTAVLHKVGATAVTNNYLGLGKYNLEAAFRAEEFMRMAKDRNLVVFLEHDVFPDFSSYNNPHWMSTDTGGPNPYNSQVGGPLSQTDPAQVWTDATAIALFKRRYRYSAARYGAFHNLIWDTWGESGAVGSATINGYVSVSGVGATVRANQAAQHAILLPYLDTVDPTIHLKTWSEEWEPATGSTVGQFDAMWSLPGMSLSEIHRYRVDEPGPGGQTLRGTYEPLIKRLQDQFAKPTFVGEFGMSSSGTAIEAGYSVLTGSFTTNQRNHLKQATHFHNGEWMMMVGLKTGILPFYSYNYMHDSGTARPTPDWPQQPKLYPPLAAYLAGEDWGALTPILARFVPTVPASVYAWGIKNDRRAYIWIRDAKNQYSNAVADGVSYGPGNIATTRTMSGIVLTIPGLPGLVSGTYDVEVWAPYSTDSLTAPTGSAGGKFSTLSATSVGGALSVTLPDFTRDIAIKILPAAGSVPPPPPDPATLTRLLWRGVVVGPATSITVPDGVLPDATGLAAYVTVQDSDGLTATLNQATAIEGSATAAFSMTATASAQVSAALPIDAFARTVSGGWGTADQGGDYTGVLSGGLVVADQAVTSGVATINLSHTGGLALEILPAISLRDVTVSVQAKTSKLTVGGIQQVSLMLRVIDASNYYHVDLEFWPDHTVHLNIQKVVNNTQTLIGTTAIAGLTHAADTYFWLKASVSRYILDTTQTFITAKGWLDGTAEPADILTPLDAAAALQVPGGVGLRAYIGNAATNVPVLATFDLLTSSSP